MQSQTALKPANRRELIAIAIASVGAIAGAAYTSRHGVVYSTAIFVGGLWAALALWVDPSPFLHKSMGEILQAARERRLPKSTLTARGLNVGALALFALGLFLQFG